MLQAGVLGTFEITFSKDIKQVIRQLTLERNHTDRADKNTRPMFKPNRHFLVKGSFCKPFDVSSLCSALYLYFVKVLHSMETSSNLPLPLFPLFLLLHLHRHFSDLLLLENQSINDISNIGKSPHQKSDH